MFFLSSKKIRGFKIILLGDGAVGKTSLRNRYLGVGFKENYAPTLGANFAVQKITTTEDDGDTPVIYTFQIWDIAGQKYYQQVRKLFYKGAMGTLLLYDITIRESFENVVLWTQECWSNTGRGPIPTILIANKIDLRGKTANEVTTDEGMALADELRKDNKVPVNYLETSAKTGLNVNEAFLSLAKAIMEKFIV